MNTNVKYNISYFYEVLLFLVLFIYQTRNYWTYLSYPRISTIFRLRLSFYVGKSRTFFGHT